MKKLFNFITVALLGLLFLVPNKPANAAPPTNFQKTLIIGSGLAGPSGFEIAPDGRIFILQRTGEVKIYKNGALLPQNFTVLPSAASGDRGLIGIAFDPNYLTNHWVYFYYTSQADLKNYLVRFDASTDVAQNGPIILYQTIDQSFQLHVGGTIRFGPDGKLYLSIGDNGYPPNAQNLSNPHGKILRLNKDGSAPSDNPFVGVPGALPEIYAYGLRNPFRFQFDSTTGKLFLGNVGEATWENVDNIVRGGRYGWPQCEGYCNPPDPSIIDPIYSYNHNGGSAAVVGGPVYHGQLFPSDYQGRLFFGDYAMGFIKTMTLDGNGNRTGVFDFDNNAGSVVDMKVDPRDGSLYYITYYPGALYQITYSTGTKVPVANASSDVTKGVQPLTVHFSSQGSNDPNGLPITYNWDFGDGTNSIEANPTKTYPNKGQYTVQLRVSNGTYTALANPIVIQVGIPPKITIGTPQDRATYKAGDSITVNVSAVDGAGFDISDGSLATTIVFHHQTHIHPFLGPLTGRSNTFTIPNTGESSPDTWFEIDATATDTSGLQSTAVTQIYPNKVNLSFNTITSGLQILLDGIPTNTPISIQSVVGFMRELSAPFVQKLNGVVYQLDHWSDGGTWKHLITTSNVDASFTAFFNQVPPFKGEYFSNRDLTGNPVLTRNDAAIDFDWGTGSPDPSIPNTNFSVRWTKIQNFKAGTYKFTTSTDDGTRLFVDNNLIIDQWHDQATTSYNATIKLTDGDHPIKMEYYQAAGGAVAKLVWDMIDQGPVATPTPTPGGTPQKLGGMNLDGYCKSKGQTGAAVVNGTWNCTPSNTAIDMNASCVWQYVDANAYAKQDIAGNVYSWTCYTNGAAPNPTPTPTPVINPTPTPIPAAGYQAKYWNTPGAGSAPSIPATQPTLTRTDAAIDFDWGAGSPDPIINNDHFVAVWTKTDVFEAATYKFTASADDGVRVYVDNLLIIDKWIDQPTTTYSADQVLTAGNHDIKVEYYENTGGATAKFSYVKLAGTVPTPTPIAPTPTPIVPTPTPTPGPSQTYQGQYWNTPGAGSKPAIPATAPTLSRTDAAINFDWGGGSPDPIINNDHFVARWTKTDVFEASNYTFTITGDDGVRVYVDNQLLIDKWVDQGPTTYIADKVMTAGNHDIKVEYYENTGGAVVKFSYVKNVTPVPTPTYAPGQQKLGGMDLHTYCVNKGQTGSALANGTWTCTPSGTPIDMDDACKKQYTEPTAIAKQDVPGNPYTWSCYK